MSDNIVMKKGKNWHEWDGVKYDVDTFYNELAWEEIIFDKDRHPHHRVWGYTQTSYPCGSCKQTADIQFNIQRGGVTVKCRYCKISTLAPPYDVENEIDVAELLDDKIVSSDEAYKISTRIGVSLPIAPPRTTRRKKTFGQKEE